jgi:predicted nucleotidyltransferase
VFGSLLHGFYHPDLSDIDLTIYGKGNIQTLRETLQEVYAQGSSPLKNEFETCETLKGKAWRFKNFSSEEYVWHQRRKQIYAVFENGKNGRKIKTEFEPVKEWREIHNDYDSETSVARIGWVKILARVVRDSDGPFIPSIYEIEPLRVLKGKKVAQEAIRILSYLEEFRMQVNRDETIEVEGNLEQVTNKKKSYYQVALTRCARYYEQVLKSTETGA